MDRLSVIVCDDVPLLRQLARYGLEEEADIEVVAEAGDGEEGIRAVGEHRPDVVLLDLSMPGVDGLDAISSVREASPETAIVVYSGTPEDRMAEACYERGADSYLEKGSSMEVLRERVRQAAAARTAADAAGEAQGSEAGEAVS